MYPVELHGIRSLFLQQQYRYCTRACREVLRNMDDASELSLQRAYVLFYLGLAHDELARAMHSRSQAKMPALSSAEHFYREALESLPSSRDVRDICESLALVHQEDAQIAEVSDTESISVTPTQLRPHRSQSPDTLDSSTSESIRMAPLPSHSARNDSLLSSPYFGSAHVSPLDNDDPRSLKNHNSILTPSRLKRGLFCVSPIDPEQNSTPTNSDSISNINTFTRTMQSEFVRRSRVPRPTSPIEQPSKASTSTAAGDRRSRLPKLVTHVQTTSDARRIDTMPAEKHGSPVSPLSSEADISVASAVSPLSPQTLLSMGHIQQKAKLSLQTAAASEVNFSKIDHHVTALRAQFLVHVANVQRSKQRLIDLRTSKATLIGETPIESELARQGHGVDVTSHLETHRKQDRVLQGRARNWKRERFQAARYRALADDALAELSPERAVF